MLTAMSVHLKTAPPTQGAHNWQTHPFIFYFNLLQMLLGSAAQKPLHLLVLSSPLRSRGYQDASFLSPGIGNSFPVATCHCEREMRKLILENAYRQLFQFKMQEEVQNPRMFCPFSPKKSFQIVLRRKVTERREIVQAAPFSGNENKKTQFFLFSDLTFSRQVTCHSSRV